MNFSLKKIAIFTLALAFSCNSAMASATQCDNKEFSLQLLGSGGPISDDQRASSGEIIWWKGKPFMLIDAGGGTYLRFGQSGAKLEDVTLIGITHFHTDHVADLPAILKNGYFFSQEKKIMLFGPDRGGAFPSMTEFFEDLFSPNGAFAYLNGLHDADDGIKISMKVKNVDYKSHTPILLYQKDGVTVTALGIPHGNVPCLAYRIQTPKGVIVVSADQNGSNKDFIPFAKGADILVMPAAIDESADQKSKYMHASPSVIGKIAAETKPRILVLNHFMGKSLKLKDKTVDIIKQYYHGPIYSSRDLSCFPLIINNKSESNEK